MVTMYLLPSRLDFKVVALDSPIKLQLMSRLWRLVFAFRNSDNDSQNMLLSLFELSPRNYSPELLLSRSMHSLLPALSSRRFNLRSRLIRLLFTFSACARYLLPSYVMQLSPRFKLVRMVVYRTYLAIFLAPESPILLCARSI